MNSNVCVRGYSSRKSIKKSASLIRKEFLDYFKNDLGHSLIRSSPVTPVNDQTVPFVNAGMNQFKGVFLNYYEPPALKIANSQKCIRVDGKHNDLNVVGSDGYHHTFFEMLGNWSFGDYFKAEACCYAWNLLTEHYGIEKEFLYVTYFAGDEKLGLEPDLECKDTWLSIGIPKDRILPFGLEENFWEMGVMGPCGPCTEIHVDHRKQLINQSTRVNKGFTDLTELWNIVFVQYERLTNGTIVPLSKHHIDTGMGLERLVALLQGKESNYDTDLFQPLFKAIQKYSNAPKYQSKFHSEDEDGINSAYRILADHSRMITVALADRMLPEESTKLRRIIRKAIDVGENVFKKKGILSELSYTVADNLGHAYPELQNNLEQVRKIIEFEEDFYKRLRNTSGKEWQKIVKTRPALADVTDCMAAGLVNGYKDLQSKKTETLPGHVALKLYDTYGLSTDTIAELAKIESLHFDDAALQEELGKLKYQSKIGSGKKSEIVTNESLKLLEKSSIPTTDDSFKYKYTYDGNNYKFPSINSKIVGIVANGNLILNNAQKNIDEIVIRTNDSNDVNEIGIILDKTLCYSLEGGQESDKGFISVNDLIFNVENVRKINNYVIHFGKFSQDDLKCLEKKIKIGDDCVVSINPEIRIGAMRHHTGTHLLNASLKKVMQVVYQRSSVVLSNNLKFQFNSFGEKLSSEKIKKIEELVNNVIKANSEVTTKTLNSTELLKEDFVTLISGEVYPYAGIRLVEIDTIDLRSKEACCGTHVHNTAALMQFCLLNYASKGASNHIVKAVLGPLAVAAKKAGEKAKLRILDLERELKSGKHTYVTFQSLIDDFTCKIKSEEQIPYTIKEECLARLQILNKASWTRAKDGEKASIITEIKNADLGFPFIVHCLQQNPAYLSLHEVVSLYPKIPVLIISRNKRMIKARCCIPQEMVLDTFNAQTWMEVVLRVFDAEYGSMKGFNTLLVASMKSKDVSETSAEVLICNAITEAKNFASLHVQGLNVSDKIKSIT